MLRRLSEAVLARVLPAEESRCIMIRTLLREIFACCVLRSVMMYFLPYNLNKVSTRMVLTDNAIILQDCCTPSECDQCVLTAYHSQQ